MALTDLLLMGRERDLTSERGVSCAGELPAASDPDLVERARAARAALGSKVMILGHHYQRDEVIEFADITGDSFKLAQAAAENPQAEYVIFCGVHFMAESADVLTADNQKVILPDLAAGCSMADMASSNAKSAMEWAFTQGEKILFLPDQHLGRNTAVLAMGLSLSDCVVWNPWKPMGGLTEAELRAAKVILWRGHCSVHGRFSAQNVADVRERVPGVQVLVHPECQHEVVSIADVVGSTEKIIQTVKNSPAGSKWAIGTELNLVQRLSRTMPDKEILFLDKTVCYCSTMNRIDLPHLVWAMESLVQGQVVNQIIVPEDVRKYSKLALERMLAL